MLAGMHAQCFDQAWDEAAFSGLLDDPNSFALTIAFKGEPYSFILVRVAADESEVLSLGTIPEARRIGLARALVKAGAAEAFRLGARRMFLEVAADNEPALALYTKLGFAPTGRRPGYYVRPTTHPADAVILSIALPF